jgi:hypothetical protein
MTLRILAAIVLALAATACSHSPRPSDFPPGDVRRLGGIWVGEWRDSLGTTGNRLWFDLGPGEESVRGDMLMTTGFENPTRVYVRFVRTGPGAVEGRSSTYRDDGCDCEVTTTFDGRELADSAMTGTFIVREEATFRTRTGTWRVTRE